MSSSSVAALFFINKKLLYFNDDQVLLALNCCKLFYMTWASAQANYPIKMTQ